MLPRSIDAIPELEKRSFRHCLLYLRYLSISLPEKTSSITRIFEFFNKPLTDLDRFRTFLVGLFDSADIKAEFNRDDGEINRDLRMFGYVLHTLLLFFAKYNPTNDFNEEGEVICPISYEPISPLSKTLCGFSGKQLQGSYGMKEEKQINGFEQETLLPLPLRLINGRNYEYIGNHPLTERYLRDCSDAISKKDPIGDILFVPRPPVLSFTEHYWQRPNTCGYFWPAVTLGMICLIGGCLAVAMKPNQDEHGTRAGDATILDAIYLGIVGFLAGATAATITTELFNSTVKISRYLKDKCDNLTPTRLDQFTTRFFQNLISASILEASMASLPLDDLSKKESKEQCQLSPRSQAGETDLSPSFQDRVVELSPSFRQRVVGLSPSAREEKQLTPRFPDGDHSHSKRVSPPKPGKVFVTLTEPLLPKEGLPSSVAITIAPTDLPQSLSSSSSRRSPGSS